MREPLYEGKSNKAKAFMASLDKGLRKTYIDRKYVAEAKSQALKERIQPTHPIKGRSHYSKKTYSHE